MYFLAPDTAEQSKNQINILQITKYMNDEWKNKYLHLWNSSLGQDNGRGYGFKRERQFKTKPWPRWWKQLYLDDKNQKPKPPNLTAML